jgi:nitrite reductase (NADH) small subunit
MTTISAPTRAAEWNDVASAASLTPDRGSAVLVAGHQVAVFVLQDGAVHALDNRDPDSGANVMSRGIVGDRGGIPVVASPIYKQCFELATGRCLDDPELTLQTHAVRLVDGRVHVRLRGAGRP